MLSRLEVLASPAEAVLAAPRRQQGAAAGGPAQDLTLVNGRIHTMDARNTVASTVTIRNGRFAAVGAANNVAAQAGTRSSTCVGARSCRASSKATSTS